MEKKIRRRKEIKEYQLYSLRIRREFITKIKNLSFNSLETRVVEKNYRQTQDKTTFAYPHFSSHSFIRNNIWILRAPFENFISAS